jgi:hypothetical protein
MQTKAHPRQLKSPFNNKSTELTPKQQERQQHHVLMTQYEKYSIFKHGENEDHSSPKCLK